MEWSLGNLKRAVQLAEEADARHPSKRTALTLGELRLADGDRFGAIEAYERADGLGSANAALELADLYEDPGTSAQRSARDQRYTSPKAPGWACYQPHARAQALERITQIRERRLVCYDGSSVRSAQIAP